MNSTKLLVSFGIVIVLGLLFEAADTHHLDHAAEDVSAEHENRHDLRPDSRVSDRHNVGVRRWPFYMFREPPSGEYGSNEDGTFEDTADRQARRHYREHRRRFRDHDRHRHRSAVDHGLGYSGAGRAGVVGRRHHRAGYYRRPHSAPTPRKEAVSSEEKAESGEAKPPKASKVHEAPKSEEEESTTEASSTE